MNTLVGASYQYSTIPEYYRTWKEFSKLLSSLNQPNHFPATPHQVALFAAHLFRLNSAPSTIRSKLSAIAWFHKLHTVSDPTHSFPINRILVGAAKGRPKGSHLLPIDKDLLTAFLPLIPKIHPTNYYSTMATAIMLLAYHGCFRVGELLVSCSQEHTLRADNIKTVLINGKTHLHINIPSFKHSRSLPLSSFPRHPRAHARYLGHGIHEVEAQNTWKLLPQPRLFTSQTAFPRKYYQILGEAKRVEPGLFQHPFHKNRKSH